MAEATRGDAWRVQAFDRLNGAGPSPAGPHRWPRALNCFALLVVYFAMAAAAFHGFYSKWGLRDQVDTWDERRGAIEGMLDGTAYRPFVYRQLLPFAANFIDAHLPPPARARLLAGSVRPDGRMTTRLTGYAVTDPRYTIRYTLLYYMAFLLYFAALLLMRQVCLAAGAQPVPATLAPLALALFTPFLLTVGGYFYDFSEVFFLMLSALLALRGRWWALVPLAALATSNKEAYLFFVPALYPFLRLHLPRLKAAAVIAAMMLLSGLTYLWIKSHYQANPGANLEVHLWDNLRFYLNPKHLVLGYEVTYGVFAWRGYSLVMLLLLAWIVVHGWNTLGGRVREHIVVALCVNVPLSLCFAQMGELRNLSLVSVGLLLLIAASLPYWIGPASAGPAGWSTAADPP